MCNADEIAARRKVCQPSILTGAKENVSGLSNQEESRNYEKLLRLCSCNPFPCSHKCL